MSDQDLRKKEDDEVLDELQKDFSPTEQAEYDKLSQNDPEEADSDEKLGKGFRKEPARPGLRAATSNVSTFRKLSFAVGLMGILITIGIAIFSFLLPFKLNAIVESIEQRVGDIPGYAVDRRLEFYMNRYLMIRSLEATGDFDFSPGGADRDRFTYLGDSFWKTMYVNWKGAKLENSLVDRYGIKIRADVNPEIFRTGSTLRANQFRVEIVDPNKAHSHGIREGPLNRTETRNFIKQFAKDGTRSTQVFKRFHMRRVMKKYFGVGNWKPFENQIDNAKNTYYEKKRTYQTRLIEETVGRFSQRYGLYMDCLLGSSTAKACRDTLKKPDPDIDLPDTDSKNSGIDDAKEAVDDLTPDNGSDTLVRKEISGEVSDQIEEFGLKKTMAVIAGPLAIIEFVDTFSKIEAALNSGVLNQIVYDKNAQQYLAYAATIQSANDQGRSGEDYSLVDHRVAQESFDGYEESPVYQAGIPGHGTVSAAGGIYRDCNNDDGDGKETLLDPGETVCPNKRLVQNKTSFTSTPTWTGLHSVFENYRSGPIDDILKFTSGLVSSLVDATGLDSVIQKLAEVSGFNDFLAKGFAFLLNRIASPVATGAEVGDDAYENLYAGIASERSAVGGDVGVSKEDTIGGGYLSDKQFAAIRDEQMAEYYNEVGNKSFFVRYFSPSVKESLMGQLAMHMPSTVGATGQQIATTLTNPFKVFGSVGNFFSPSANAAVLPETNPFHVINMGFAADDPVFTANDGEGMDYGEINARYHCDIPAADRDQNKQFGRPDDLPFDVPTASDPCLLEEAVKDASTRYFDGSFDEGVSADAATTPTTAGGASVVGDPSTESTSVQCATGTKDLGVKPGYNDGTPISVRLCAIPTIVSNSLESQSGNLFSIPGADGKLIVNSRISGAVLAMSQAASNGTVTLKAESGWRSNEHQEALWYQLGQNTTYVARPGFSNHQAGAAIDFDLINPVKKDSSSCDTRAQSPGDPMWEWLATNAPRYGFGQYTAESWHWDATSSDRICR